MRNPDYISYLTKDYYIEPVSLEQGEEGAGRNILELTKGEPILYGPMKITFKQFDLAAHDKGGMMGSGGAMNIGAVLEIATEKDVQTLTPITSYGRQGTPEMKTAYLKNSKIGFQLVAMAVGTTKGSASRIRINVIGLGSMAHGGGEQKPEILIAEVSIKPFMSFVWIAAVLIVLGLMVAMMRRLKQNNI
jgi:hypothetical protein